MLSPTLYRYTLLVCLTLAGLARADDAGHCAGFEPGKRNLYWGDLHVHTGYSMDAYAYGTTATPADAYVFARGGAITLPDGKTRQQLRRPLDFTAVTDHAETFDVMQLCTVGAASMNNAYCRGLREGAGLDPANARKIFINYLLPVIAGARPALPALCSQEGVDCDAARKDLWQQVQDQANAANTPCEFVAFIANEWSATPNHAHWHRNLIFEGEAVTSEAIDYVRYPTPLKLWQVLAEDCRPEEGCDVVAIPHNTNFSEGGGFDVESADDAALQLRSRYERLVEIHQAKGNSECIAENWDDAGSDCGFEIAFTTPAMKKRVAEDPDYLARVSRSYVRNILSRGLQAYKDKGDNPLKLGFVGSTDIHVATPGATEEDTYVGDIWGGGGSDPMRTLSKLDYNPGGLVGIWAEEKTRASLFAALKRRETYATSGTRISMRFSADESGEADACSPEYDYRRAVPMGSSLGFSSKSPRLTVFAHMDQTPLEQVEIIAGTLAADGELRQRVINLQTFESGSPDACLSFTDPEFDPDRPAYWYARVKEQATPRWSKRFCESLDNCNEVPGADRMIQETAWSSPIWYLP